MLLQSNDKVWHQSHLTRNHPRGEQKNVGRRCAHEFFGIAAGVEDDIHEWGNIEVSEVRRNGEENVCYWSSRAETVVKFGLEQPNWSRIVTYSWLALSSHEMHFTPLEMVAEVI